MFKIFVPIILLMGITFFWYFKHSQAQIALLTENNAKLEVAVQLNEEALESIKQNLVLAQQEVQRVNAEFSEIGAQNNVLAQKLQKHDLGVLAAAKPGLVQKIVNNATKKAARCFELLSGAEQTEAEKNATSAKTFNSECPWLWTGSVQ